MRGRLAFSLDTASIDESDWHDHGSCPELHERDLVNWFTVFGQEESVKADVTRLKQRSLAPDNLLVQGINYGCSTGRLAGACLAILQQRYVSMKLLMTIALTTLMSAHAIAGHSGPLRDAGRLLAITQIFEKRCSDFGSVDKFRLLSELKELGVDTLTPENNSGAADYREEYLAEIDVYIREKTIRAFCQNALKAYLDKKTPILKPSE